MANAIRNLGQHGLSILSVCAITLNLLLWTLPVIAAVTAHALARSPGARARCYGAIDWIYRSAVRFDSWWVRRVLAVDIRIHGDRPVDPGEQLIVVSNHRSWFDILVLHYLVTSQGPIIKFLIKRELIYVPVVGWLCLALNFPRLNRGSSSEGREHDYRSVMNAAESLREAPGALLNFAEGTRFSVTKHQRQQSPFAHMLKPRSGGMRIMLATLPNAGILDCTLVYPDDTLSFWQCLGGRLKTMEVWLDRLSAAEIDDVNHWLDTRWRIKNARIEHSAIRMPLLQ